MSFAQRWGQAEPESSPLSPLKFDTWTSEEFPWPKLHQFRIFRRWKVVSQHPEPSDTRSKIKSQASKQGNMILLALTRLLRAANSPCSSQPGFQKDHIRRKSDKHIVASIKAMAYCMHGSALRKKDVRLLFSCSGPAPVI